MPGYVLIEQSTAKPYKENGIELFQNKMEILDFIRQISHEVFPFPKYYQIQLTGLEDVLFWSGENERERALEIKKKLREYASELERRLINIQIIMQGKIMRGDTMWLEYRGKRLSINLIFGNLNKQTDSNGNSFYITSFNLTNGI